MTFIIFDRKLKKDGGQYFKVFVKKSKGVRSGNGIIADHRPTSRHHEEDKQDTTATRLNDAHHFFMFTSKECINRILLVD